MSFILDPQLSSSCFEIMDWPLCRVLLKDNADFPWLILVPRQNGIQEIMELSPLNQHRLIEEISLISTIMKHYFKPDKLNIGSLGNVVSQLHIHIIARFRHDSLWPQGIWQKELNQKSYHQKEVCQLIDDLSRLMKLTLEK